MIQSKERLIDGERISVSQLPAMKALRLFNRLGRTLGPAIARGSGALEGGNFLDLDMSALAGSVEVLFSNLTEDELESITRDLLATARMNDKEILPAFDLIFAGRLTFMFKCLTFAFEVNYGDFFDAFKRLSSAGARTVPSSSQTH